MNKRERTGEVDQTSKAGQFLSVHYSTWKNTHRILSQYLFASEASPIYVCLSLCLCLCLCLSVCLSLRLCLFLSLSVCLFVCLLVCLSLSLFDFVFSRVHVWTTLSLEPIT